MPLSQTRLDGIPLGARLDLLNGFECLCLLARAGDALHFGAASIVIGGSGSGASALSSQAQRLAECSRRIFEREGQ